MSGIRDADPLRGFDVNDDEPGQASALTRIQSALSNAGLSGAEISTETGKSLLELIVLSSATGKLSPPTLRSHLRMALEQRSKGPDNEKPISDQVDATGQ